MDTIVLPVVRSTYEQQQTKKAKESGSRSSTMAVPAPWMRLSQSEIWNASAAFTRPPDAKRFSRSASPFKLRRIRRSAAHMRASYHRGSATGTAASIPRNRSIILELEPGTGRFTFLFTQDLRRLLDRGGLGHIRTRHVCADLSSPLLDHIAGHEALAPFLERGLLDFAIFDAADLQPPLLRREGRPLTRQLVANPLIVIASGQSRLQARVGTEPGLHGMTSELPSVLRHNPALAT